jgi:hypothetical protein
MAHVYFIHSILGTLALLCQYPHGKPLTDVVLNSTAGSLTCVINDRSTHSAIHTMSGMSVYQMVLYLLNQLLTDMVFLL